MIHQITPRSFEYLNLSDNRNYSYEDLFDYNFVNNSHDNSSQIMLIMIKKDLMIFQQSYC